MPEDHYCNRHLQHDLRHTVACISVFNRCSQFTGRSMDELHSTVYILSLNICLKKCELNASPFSQLHIFIYFKYFILFYFCEFIIYK